MRNKKRSKKIGLSARRKTRKNAKRRRGGWFSMFSNKKLDPLIDETYFKTYNDQFTKQDLPAVKFDRGSPTIDSDEYWVATVTDNFDHLDKKYYNLGKITSIEHKSWDDILHYEEGRNGPCKLFFYWYTFESKNIRLVKAVGKTKKLDGTLTHVRPCDKSLYKNVVPFKQNHWGNDTGNLFITGDDVTFYCFIRPIYSED
jgi:hypothetical protein